MGNLLLAALLASIVTLAAVAALFRRGESGRAGGILLRWGIGVLAYVAILIVTPLLPGNRGLRASLR